MIITWTKLIKKDKKIIDKDLETRESISNMPLCLAQQDSQHGHVSLKNLLSQDVIDKVAKEWRVRRRVFVKR